MSVVPAAQQLTTSWESGLGVVGISAPRTTVRHSWGDSAFPLSHPCHGAASFRVDHVGIHPTSLYVFWSMILDMGVSCNSGMKRLSVFACPATRNDNLSQHRSVRMHACHTWNTNRVTARYNCTSEGTLKKSKICASQSVSTTLLLNHDALVPVPKNIASVVLESSRILKLSWACVKNLRSSAGNRHQRSHRNSSLGKRSGSMHRLSMHTPGRAVTRPHTSLENNVGLSSTDKS